MPARTWLRRLTSAISTNTSEATLGKSSNGPPGRAWRGGMITLCWPRSRPSQSAWSPRPRVRAPGSGLLLAAGTVEKETVLAASMRSADSQRAETWTVPGTAHTQGLETAPEEWKRRVVGFLDSHFPPGDVSDRRQTRPRTAATGR